MGFLEIQLPITQNVSKHLGNRFDDQQEYLRRSCLVVNGLMDPGKEDDHNSNSEKIIAMFSKESGIWKDIKENIDKIYPLGKLVEEGKELRILLKFAGKNFKETIYGQHKNCIKTCTSN